MNSIEELLRENLDNRKLAQTWFLDDDKRIVSSEHDNRETGEIQELSLNVLFAQYTNAFGKKPSTFLEVGCNTGEVFEKIYNHMGLDDLELYGIDPSESAISIAKNKFKTAKLNVGKAEDINTIRHLPPFDTIFVHLCLGLWDNPTQGIKNLVSSMSRNSIIYIVDLDKSSRLEGIEAAINSSEKEYLKDQYNASFSKDELHYILETGIEGTENISFELGTASLGGFQYNSKHFIKLINNPRIQKVLRTYKNEKFNGTPPFQLQHGWIFKNDSS